MNKPMEEVAEEVAEGAGVTIHGIFARSRVQDDLREYWQGMIE